jgi:hypothetical protein
MKCPTCKQTDTFKTDMWEVNSFAADLEDADITNPKHNDCKWIAIDADGGTRCLGCSYESSTSEFLDSGKEEAFPVLPCPDLEGLKDGSSRSGGHCNDAQSS